MSLSDGAGNSQAKPRIARIAFATGGIGAIKTVEEFTQVLRSEEHTSELQSLMRISYAVFCLKKKKHERLNSHEMTKINNPKKTVTCIIETYKDQSRTTTRKNNNKTIRTQAT